MKIDGSLPLWVSKQRAMYASLPLITSSWLRPIVLYVFLLKHLDMPSAWLLRNVSELSVSIETVPLERWMQFSPKRRTCRKGGDGPNGKRPSSHVTLLLRIGISAFSVTRSWVVLTRWQISVTDIDIKTLTLVSGMCFSSDNHLVVIAAHLLRPFDMFPCWNISICLLPDFYAIGISELTGSAEMVPNWNGDCSFHQGADVVERVAMAPMVNDTLLMSSCCYVSVSLPFRWLRHG